MQTDAQPVSQIDAEEAEYRRKSADLKLKNILLQGIGAATVFGIMSSFVGKFLAMATTSHAVGLAAAVPYLGLAAIVAVGIGCIYFGAKYYAESVRLDNYQQAKKITCGMAVRSPAIAQNPYLLSGAEKDHAPGEEPGRSDGKSWVVITASTAASRDIQNPQADWATRASTAENSTTAAIRS